LTLDGLRGFCSERVAQLPHRTTAIVLHAKHVDLFVENLLDERKKSTSNAAAFRQLFDRDGLQDVAE
jgi:hypothetical protein